MAIYYVKSGGTATADAGRATSARTGSFATMGASAYYPSLASVFSTPSTAYALGDFIYISSASTHNYGANQTLTGLNNSPTIVISVDDTNADQYLAGAKEEATGGLFDIIFAEYWNVFGVHFEAGDDIATTASDVDVILTDCTVTLTSAASKMNIAGSGNYGRFTNCSFNLDSSTSHITVAGANRIDFYGGSVSSTSGALANVLNGVGAAGCARFIGTDLTGCVGHLVSDYGAAYTDNTGLARFYNCKTSASLTGYVEEAATREGQRVEIANCSDVSAAAEYQFFISDFGGTVEDQDDTGIHRDESTAFDGATKVSIKVTTDANCTPYTPLWFDLPTTFAALSAASTDTIRAYFAVSNATTLTDNDVWAELIYPDGTNKQTFNFLSNRATDIIAAGTTHTDDSAGSTWKNGGVDLTAHNEYLMDLDTSGDVGADSVPIIRIYVGVPSVTIYVDTSLGVVA